MGSIVRISRNPKKFNTFLSITDKLQNTGDAIPGSKRYERYGWKLTENQQWTAFRNESNILYAILSNPATIGTAVRIKMKDLIRRVRAYDNDAKDGHHLLDKVALNGEVDDWFTFNVKRGTVLSGSVAHHCAPVKLPRPRLSIAIFEVGHHVLIAVNPDNPGSKALPDGVAFLKLYRYIGTIAPMKLSQYEFNGNAKRGRFASEFSKVEAQGNIKLVAYYFARYESKKGVLGTPGNLINGDIMLRCS